MKENNIDENIDAESESDSIRPGQKETAARKTERHLKLKYRMIRMVRDLRETQVQVVCEVVDAVSNEVVKTKVISDRKFNEERSNQLVTRVVGEKRLRDFNSVLIDDEDSGLVK